jgi:UDP-N-acetylglucosamine:LPS N-acetylglucosamine transferase
VELCEWADVVIIIASSIIIEALTQNKPALYLKYLHENTTEYEELGACWIIHDENELRDALLSLQKNRTKLPYTDENVNRFLSEIIYGGRDERDVLKDYGDFIVNSAAK